MEQGQKGHMEEESTKAWIICRFFGKAEQLANMLRVTLKGPKVEGPMKQSNPIELNEVINWTHDLEKKGPRPKSDN